MLPILYKRSAKSGKTNQWSVSTSDERICVEQGQVGGAMQKYLTVCEGKNIGRANETSPSEQAISEAKSKWEKQIKKGYSEDPEAGTTVLKPMQVHKYTDHKKKIKFPCDISPKLNGLCGEHRASTDQFLSRGGEDYPKPSAEAQAELFTLCHLLKTNSLNYEIYKHGEWLQDIVSAVRKPEGEYKYIHQHLEYHVFDIPELDLKWKDKREVILDIMKTEEYKNFCKVEFVPFFRCNSHEDIERYMQEFLEAGYEGSVIRNDEGEFVYNTRSYDVLKYKIPLEEEFKVIGYKIDKNNQVVLQCESSGGDFWPKPKGDKAHREKIRLEVDSWVGRYVTVEFESYSKDGKPTKPIAIRLREGYVNEQGEFIPTE